MANDYLEAFARESEEQITRLNNALLDFEDDPSDEAAMEDIFRTAHTLKGNCGAMGFEDAEELAHAIEDLLESIRSNRVAVTTEVMDAIFDGVDELEAMIDEAVTAGEVGREAGEVIETLRSLADVAGPTEPTDEEVDDVLATATPPADSQYSVYHVRLSVAGDPAVHGRAVIDALDDAFDLLATDPEPETVDAGEYDGTLDAVFASVVETAAVEAALAPVDAVADQVIAEVTDRVESDPAGTAADDATGSGADADAPPDDASGAAGDADGDAGSHAIPEDVSVDELLQDEDVDQFDDLDEMADEIEDASEFDDLGDAGSFADLGVGEDDVDVETGTAGADEADDAAVDDAADAADEAVADATADDDQVDDAAAVFEELQEEVDPVGFDELQDELAELEFDEYDTDEEVGFDELLGAEDVDEGAPAAVDAAGEDGAEGRPDAADAPSEAGDSEPEESEPAPADAETDPIPSESGPDATDVEPAAEDHVEAPTGPEPGADAPAEEPDATAADLFGGDAAAEDAMAEDAVPEDAMAEDAVPEDAMAEDAMAEDVEAEDTTVADAAPDSVAEDAVAEDAASPADATAGARDPEPADDPDASLPDASDGSAADEAGAFGEDELDLTDSTGADAADADGATPADEAGAAPTDEAANDGAAADAADAPGASADHGVDAGEEAEALDSHDIDFGEGTVPAAEPDEPEETDALGTGDALDDDSFGDVEATDDGGHLADDAVEDEAVVDEAVEDGAIEGFGDDAVADPGDDSVLDLDAEPAADASTDEAPAGDAGAPVDTDAPVDDEPAASDLESDTDLDDAGIPAADETPGAEDTLGDGEVEAATDAALEDPGFGDASEPEGDGPEVDEERLERIRTLGVPEHGGEEASEATGVQSIRVDVQQLDRMLNLVEGLVTSRARLRRALLEDEPRDVLEEELDDLEDVTSELQDTVMDVRLVPLRTAVNKLPRTVRDVAREEDKRVDFRMEGEDVEIDRSILDEIGDPLVHLVRNAVDHGIEPPAEREAADKAEEGTVELRAVRERDRVRIAVEDDGRGIDPDRLRDAAVEEGIQTRAAVEELSDDEVTDLIFHSGFSTAEQVTDVSGRGVGMDVVRETVDRLDGSVRVDSELGEGTTIEMELPVSLAIAEVLFVEVGGEEYGIPIKVVDEIGPVIGVETEDGQEVLASDGGEDPRELLRLDRELGTPGRADPSTGMLVHLRDDVREAALHCEAVREQQEVVVKPFEGVLGDVPGLGGATVLGDGDVVNILDVETL